ncbi:hypothetical protein F5J12DRAFT_848365 [Pisolithus orientalis]|uniref:uncharacterized protein n=1 Tax=Pisolithus orientalis TaxID=936130 RepID=UPI002224F6AA|nr:uncharacterized protein F5J12DRAFT_848365 [Pisolithus orientalis]KAI5998929.1 hypothetical protein F5J12DRAFT_848365 [Pisolithus orientalis]
MAEWPDFITRSFKSAVASDPPGTDESVFYGPYTRLLYNLFSLDGPYEVMPQYKARGTQEKIDITAVFVVELRQHPADNQMRQRLQSLGRQLTIPVLHGISAFGTCLCFYTYHTRSQEMSLQSIAGIVTSCKLMEWNA